MLIAIEGLDGAGKTTLIEHLEKILPNCVSFKPFTMTDDIAQLLREKQSVEARKAIKTAMLNQQENFLNYLQENPNSLVLLDRWILSAIVYSSMEDASVEEVKEYISGFVIPDKTIFLDVYANVCYTRIQLRELLHGIKRSRYEETEEILETAYCGFIYWIASARSEHGIHFTHKLVTKPVSSLASLIHQVKSLL